VRRGWIRSLKKNRPEVQTYRDKSLTEKCRVGKVPSGECVVKVSA
jgi:hypothetical protein